MTLCTVYRSGKRAEIYLYLARGRAFDDLPGELRAAFGEPVFVMQLKLDEGRRLAHVDVRLVLQRLEDPGYFLQLPPELSVEEEISRRFAGPVKD
jgi:uncharacterized protein YcgL (UPF0745 family)